MYFNWRSSLLIILPFIVLANCSSITSSDDSDNLPKEETTNENTDDNTNDDEDKDDDSSNEKVSFEGIVYKVEEDFGGWWETSDDFNLGYHYDTTSVVEGVEVSLGDSTKETDASGTFNFSGLNPDSYTLSFQHRVLLDKESTIEINEDKTQNFYFKIDRSTGDHFYPLQIGNQWVWDYSKIFRQAGKGITDSSRVTLEWEITSREKKEGTEIYTVKQNAEGYKWSVYSDSTDSTKVNIKTNFEIHISDNYRIRYKNVDYLENFLESLAEELKFYTKYHSTNKTLSRSMEMPGITNKVELKKGVGPVTLYHSIGSNSTFSYEATLQESHIKNSTSIPEEPMFN